MVFGLSMTFFLDAFGGVFVFFREAVELVVTGSDSGSDWASTSKATSTKLDGLVDEFITLGAFFFQLFGIQLLVCCNGLNSELLI